MEALFIHIANKLENIRFGRHSPSGKVFDLSEVKSVDLWRAVFAEFLAQVLFLFLGGASAIAIAQTGSDTDFVRVSTQICAACRDNGRVLSLEGEEFGS